MPLIPSVSFEQAWECAIKITGWFSGLEGRALWDAGLESLDQYGAIEVGCYYGRSTSVLCHLLHGSGIPLILIDPFVGFSEQGGNPKDGTRQELLANLEPIGTPFQLIEKISWEVPAAELPSVIDLLHVDGDHREEGVRKDCIKFLPLVRVGGFALFHDYANPGTLGIPKAVDEFTQGWEVRGTFDNLRVLRRLA